MLRVRSLFVSVLVAAAVVHGEVVSLTPGDFDSHVNGDKHVLVKFFAPWCGHCKSMAEDYITASDAFTKYPDVLFAEVDADEHKDLGQRFDVSGFPTLKWFAKGSTEAVDYSAGRGIDDILAYVNKETGNNAFVPKAHSDVTELNPSNFDSYMKKDTGMMLKFYAPWCGHCKAMAPDYEKVATTFVSEDAVVIAKVDASQHKDLGTPFGVTGFPTLKWVPVDCHEADCVEPYESARDCDGFTKFINEKMMTKRLPGGRLDDTAGRDDKLDAVVPKFMGATLADKDAVVAEAEGLASGDDDASFYVKVMKKMVKLADGGDEWLAKEVARLTGMLDKPVAAKKKDEINKRLNIVRSFHNEL